MPRNRPGAPEDRISIQHMMDAARQAIGFTESKTRTSLDTAPTDGPARAIMRCIGGFPARSIGSPLAPEAFAAGPHSASLRAIKQRLPDQMVTALIEDLTSGIGRRTDA
jgi:hypothetical protein